MNHYKYPPYESFRHGLISSKLWLCEELEKVFDQYNLESPDIHNLGSWSNILSFMLITRRPNFYNRLYGYDIDPNAKLVADQICDTWMHQEPNVINYVKDISHIEYENVNSNSVFINCSVDHMEETEWYENIPLGCIVCIQAVDITIPDEPWFIRQLTPTLDTLIERYPMSPLYYNGTKRIQYQSWGYNRFMIIGVK